jgi:hypothetical protein
MNVLRNEHKGLDMLQWTRRRKVNLHELRLSWNVKNGCMTAPGLKLRPQKLKSVYHFSIFHGCVGGIYEWVLRTLSKTLMVPHHNKSRSEGRAQRKKSTPTVENSVIRAGGGNSMKKVHGPLEGRVKWKMCRKELHRMGGRLSTGARYFAGNSHYEPPTRLRVGITLCMHNSARIWPELWHMSAMEGEQFKSSL